MRPCGLPRLLGGRPCSGTEGAVPLLSIAISVLLLHSFHVHLFRDLVHGDDASSLPPSVAVASLGGGGLFHRHNLAIRDLPPPPSRLFPPLPLVSILFPDWEAFLLLPLLPSVVDHHKLSCLFHNNDVSPASFVGILPTSPARSAFRCPIPTSVRHHRPSCTPRLIDPTTAAPESDGHDPHCKMIRWTRLVYEAVSTPTDVIVFAKGVNRPASNLYCLFFSSTGGVTSTPVTSSAQEVFRCPHTPRHRNPHEIKNQQGPPHLPRDQGRREPNPLSSQLQLAMCPWAHNGSPRANPRLHHGPQRC